MQNIGMTTGQRLQFVPKIHLFNLAWNNSLKYKVILCLNTLSLPHSVVKLNAIFFNLWDGEDIFWQYFYSQSYAQTNHDIYHKCFPSNTWCTAGYKQMSMKMWNYIFIANILFHTSKYIKVLLQVLAQPNYLHTPAILISYTLKWCSYDIAMQLN